MKATSMHLNGTEHYTDPEIIERVLGGETQLYELLIRRNNPSLYRIGRSYGYTHQDTEDLMQETYLGAFRNLAGFAGRSSFKTWICRIMLNFCYQKKKSPVARREIMAGDLLPAKSKPMFHQSMHTESTVLNKELGRIMENALEKIPQEYRLVFTLRELNGLSIAETAELTQLSEANVKVRLTRAKNMLRNQIEKMYSPAEIYEFNLVYCDKMVENVMSKISASPLHTV